ncbi:MAG: NADPH-dependent 7-cyano-7-deazaguanine reductase QueF [Betaproteobacteria bacterium]|nr:MAG: NADPH-dependent 7-cyano-7-deazaguanine reductase QueF [Betaproteobacteria bacterium]
MTTLEGSPLGKSTGYPERYDPALLFPIARSDARQALGLTSELPFGGADLWTAYEISWLDALGKPQLAIGRFRIPADSPRIVESKSLKLYLGSFAQEHAAQTSELVRRIEADLARACGAAVAVVLASPADGRATRIVPLPGESLDELAITTDVYEPSPTLLAAHGPEVDETLRSALFRSRCPVTGQPDYGDLMIRYRGPRIDRIRLLRYLISYRRHAAFHESCVEQMFIDILHRCTPQALTIYGRFLRRGGIDINPFRSNFEVGPDDEARTARQ